MFLGVNLIQGPTGLIFSPLVYPCRSGQVTQFTVQKDFREEVRLLMGRREKEKLRSYDSYYTVDARL